MPSQPSLQTCLKTTAPSPLKGSFKAIPSGGLRRRRASRCFDHVVEQDHGIARFKRRADLFSFLFLALHGRSAALRPIAKMAPRGTLGLIARVIFVRNAGVGVVAPRVCRSATHWPARALPSLRPLLLHRGLMSVDDQTVAFSWHSLHTAPRRKPEPRQASHGAGSFSFI